MRNKPFSMEETTVSRHPDTAFREVDDEIFLIYPDGEQLYNLNPTAAALWRLMAEPMSGADMAAIVQAAFPETPGERIAADVRSALTELLDLGFIVSP